MDIITYLLIIGLLLFTYSAGWFHTFWTFVIIITLLEVLISFIVGFQSSTKNENDEDEKGQTF